MKIIKRIHQKLSDALPEETLGILYAGITATVTVFIIKFIKKLL